MGSAQARPDARPWFEAAFEARYLDVYAHRDRAAAAREVAGLVARGLVATGGRLLDLACGAGRHTLAFRASGARAVGLDLSADLLERARAEDGGALAGRLVRGDVRALPFAAEAFDAVAMLFSSWGYFDDGENAGVLGEIARVLAPGGVLALDLMNAERVRATLVPESRDERDGRTLIQRRRLSENGWRVVKEVRVLEPDGRERAWHEDVRLIGPSELDALLWACGLTLERVEGDFDGRAFDADAPRMLAWARRGGAMTRGAYR